MNKLSVLLVVLNCLAAAAVAQTNPAPAAAPAPTPAPAPVAPVVDAARLAMARETVKAMGADRQVEALSNQLKQLATAQASMIAPAGATEEQKAAAAKVQSSIEEYAAQATKDMTGALDTAFAEIFTTPELAAIKGFFTSPEGQAFKSKQQQLSMRLGPQMQQINEDLRQKISVVMQQARQAAAPAPAVSATTPPVSVTTEPVSAPTTAPVPAPAKAPAK